MIAIRDITDSEEHGEIVAVMDRHGHKLWRSGTAIDPQHFHEAIRKMPEKHYIFVHEYSTIILRAEKKDKLLREDLLIPE